MTIYTLIIFDVDRSSHITHVEHYSERPNPRSDGFFAGALPRWELHEGNLDGGDTRLLDRNIPKYMLDAYLDIPRTD